MSRSFLIDYKDENLFSNNTAGEYTYYTNPTGGKSACGQLAISETPERDSKAQAEAGGESRRTRGHDWGADDGGHLIGARFGGSTGEENLTAQNSNLNRSDYKSMENNWAEHLDNGDKVFVNIEANDPDRPTAYQGYAIYEDKDGNRDYDTFSYTNESRAELGKIDEDMSSIGDQDVSGYNDFSETLETSETSDISESQYNDYSASTESSSSESSANESSGTNYSGGYANDYGE